MKILNFCDLQLEPFAFGDGGRGFFRQQCRLKWKGERTGVQLSITGYIDSKGKDLQKKYYCNGEEFDDIRTALRTAGYEVDDAQEKAEI